MDIINMAKSMLFNLNIIDDRHYVLFTSKIKLYIDIIDEENADIRITYYKNKEYFLYKEHLHGIDIPDKIKKIFLLYQSFPDFIEDVKIIINNELIDRKIDNFYFSIHSSDNYFYLECFTDNVIPYITLLFEGFKEVSIYLDYYKDIKGYKCKISFSTYFIKPELPEIEKAIKTLLDLEVQGV